MDAGWDGPLLTKAICARQQSLTSGPCWSLTPSSYPQRTYTLLGPRASQKGWLAEGQSSVARGQAQEVEKELPIV